MIEARWQCLTVISKVGAIITIIAGWSGSWLFDPQRAMETVTRTRVRTDGQPTKLLLNLLSQEQSRTDSKMRTPYPKLNLVEDTYFKGHYWVNLQNWNESDIID